MARYLMWRPHQDVQNVQAAVERFLSGWISGTQFCWLVFMRDTGELAGSIAARKDENGYLLRSLRGAGRDLLRQPFSERFICLQIHFVTSSPSC